MRWDGLIGYLQRECDNSRGPVHDKLDLWRHLGKAQEVWRLLASRAPYKRAAHVAISFPVLDQYGIAPSPAGPPILEVILWFPCRCMQQFLFFFSGVRCAHGAPCWDLQDLQPKKNFKRPTWPFHLTWLLTSQSPLPRYHDPLASSCLPSVRIFARRHQR